MVANRIVFGSNHDRGAVDAEGLGSVGAGNSELRIVAGSSAKGSAATAGSVKLANRLIVSVDGEY
jgi:hypothetical protein